MNTSGAHAQANHGIIVGFDGSDHAIDALRWGAQTALLRDTKLTLVAAFQFPYGDYIQSMSAAQINDPSQQIAEDKLAEARTILENDKFSGEVEYFGLIGDATETLIRLSANADLVVVGQRGLGKFWGQMLGSVATALPPHAHCPTVVVHSSEEAPEVTQDGRPVCVGVDSSDNARQAAVVAAQEAKRRGVPLEIIHAQPYFTGTSTVWYMDATDKVEQHITANMAELLTEEMAFIVEQVPGVEINPVAERKIAPEAMIEATKRAQLTVVGTRGHGGFTSLLLGSVSRSTLSNAKGTVMVIPAEKN